MGVGTGGSSKFSNGGLTLPTRGLKYGFQGTINAKCLREIVVHFQMGASILHRGTIAPSSPSLAPPLGVGWNPQELPYHTF